MKILNRNLSYDYNRDFAKDARDFFSKRLSGHIGTWRYSEPLYQGDVVNGMQKWAEFVESARNGSAYYVYRDELEVIEKSKIYIEALGDITLIDLGPGSKEAILEKPGFYMNNLQTIKSYVGVDIVPEIIQRTQNIIQTNFPKIDYYGVYADFYKDRFMYPIKGTPVMVMFGQTLMNLPIDPFNKELVEKMLLFRLKQLKLSLNDGGYLIVTQDMNQNEKSLYDAYMEEADFDLNLLERIKRDVPTINFEPEAFRFEPYFVLETGAAAHTFIAKKDMVFTIENEEMKISKDDRFFMHNTFKFTPEVFIDMAQKAGFKSKSVIITENNNIALHLLESV